jgi:N-methylhydantoinase B
MIEANYPLRIRRYGFVSDTGGPGRFRGGNALVRDYEFPADTGVFSLRTDSASSHRMGCSAKNPAP